MIKTIGFRAEPKAIHWAVVEGTKKEPKVIIHDSMTPPKSYDQEADQLVWYRTRLLTILEEYQPKCGAIRLPEPSAFRKAKIDSFLKRARIEGVIFEVLGEKKIPSLAGAFNTISSEIKSKSAKAYLEKDDFRQFDWSNIKNTKIREAILVATTQLED